MAGFDKRLQQWGRLPDRDPVILRRQLVTTFRPALGDRLGRRLRVVRTVQGRSAVVVRRAA